MAGRIRATLARLGWDDLHSESRRGTVGLLAGIALAVLAALISALAGTSRSGQQLTDLIFVGLAGYLAAYVVITIAAFTRTSWHQVEQWCHRTVDGNWVNQLLTASKSGPGLAVVVSFLALVVGVAWLPRQQAATFLAHTQQLVVAVVLVTTAWFSVAVTYAVAYLLEDVRSGYTSLDFPGTGKRSFTDYLYQAIGTNTTFGTTDVGVLTSRMRRLISGHGVLAFVFNTVVLGAVVSVLV